MSITITRADVKRKCMIDSADTTYDSAVDSLITEMQPATEYTIAADYLADTGNASLQATLKLGMLELISGELLNQITRDFGATEMFSIGGLSLGENKERGQSLVAQGTARLAPFLKAAMPAQAESVLESTTTDDDPSFSLEESVW
jgi:hypothetical protein